MWQYNGQKRPPFAEQPGEGQESVWDYPRPPKIVRDDRTVTVYTAVQLLAKTNQSLRVLETASPPSFYIPWTDVHSSRLVKASGISICEWKGRATYWGLYDASDTSAVGWSYENPHGNFRQLKSYMTFYPGRVACYVDGQRVTPQDGLFYGGWITSELVGPFKGAPGTEHW
ncbi:MAG: DUF427 domain-containing protein [Caldithrix sp.]|nr:DUF427 domain-containing protein [Caldithrix sp.]